MSHGYQLVMGGTVAGALLNVMVGCSTASQESRPVRFQQDTGSPIALHESGPIGAVSLDHGQSDTLTVARTLNFNRPFFDVTDIAVVGERILLADRLMTPHFAVLSRDTGVPERWFGLNGERGGQFVEPACISSSSATPPTAWLYDKKTARLSLAQLDGARGAVLLEHVPLERQRGMICAHWAAGRLIAPGIYDEALFLEFDRNGRYLGARGTPPFPGSRVLNQFATTLDPDGHRLAIAFRYTSRVELFRANGVREAVASTPTPVVLRLDQTRDSITGDPRPALPDESLTEHAYLDVTASRTHVYALFCGCRKMRPWAAGNTVHVFTWNGSLVARLRLDQKLSKIAVTDDDAFLYGAYHSTATTPPLLGEWVLPRRLSVPGPVVADGAVRTRPPVPRPGMK